MGQLLYWKGALESTGLGKIYHDAWWRWSPTRQFPLTEWNFRHNSIFIHIPRTAGWSIYEMFSMDRPGDTHCPVAGYRAAAPELFSGALKFAIVRNPFDRLVSAFYHVKFGSHSTDAAWVQDREWSERYLANINTFRDFLDALRQPYFRRFVLTWRHFIPQHYFIADISGIAVDVVVPYEDLRAGLCRVARLLGLELQWITRNNSDHRPYQELFTENDVEFVYKMYSRDFYLFHYR